MTLLDFFQAAVAKSGNDKVKLAGELQNVKGFMGTAGEFNMSSEDHTGLSKDSFIIAEIKKTVNLFLLNKFFC